MRWGKIEDLGHFILVTNGPGQLSDLWMKGLVPVEFQLEIL